MTEQTFAIWSEGYAATGESGRARYHGACQAANFAEACRLHFQGNLYFNREQLTYWGWRLYDNEADARKSFG